MVSLPADNPVDLANGTTAITQAKNDNSTKLATTGYVDALDSDDIEEGAVNKYMTANQESLLTNVLGTRWESGLATTANGPADKKVDVSSGVFYITSTQYSHGGTADFDFTADFTALSAGQRQLAEVYIDNTNTVKRVLGTAVSGTSKAQPPSHPVSTVCLAIVKLDKNKGTIEAADITDCRTQAGAGVINTDEQVKISSNDTTAKFLGGALSNNGNITFTEENDGGNETLKADAPVFSGAGADGLIPDPVTSTGKFIKDDGTWANVSGNISWQGAWVSQNYVVDDLVEYQGSSYICILDTTTQQVPTNATYWEKFAAGLSWKGDWTSTDYVVDDVVRYATDGKVYICILDTTTQQVPTNATYWDIFVDASDPLTTKGDLLVHNGTVTVRLPAGATDGDLLAVDSSTAEGLAWVKRVNKRFSSTGETTEAAQVLTTKLTGTTPTLDNGDYVFDYQFGWSSSANSKASFVEVSLQRAAETPVVVYSESMNPQAANQYSHIMLSYDFTESGGGAAYTLYIKFKANQSAMTAYIKDVRASIRTLIGD